MENESVVVEKFAAGVSAIRRRTIILFAVILLSCLAVGVYLISISAVEIKRRQVAQLDAAIAERNYQLKLLDNQVSAYQKLLAETAPYTPTDKVADLTELESGRGPESDPTVLVKKFNGDDRLLASNQLIQAYKEKPSQVVAALINAIQTEELPTSYRVNLYVAFTLARIDPYWSGNANQFERIAELRRSTNYQDPTFKKWVVQASRRFRVITT